MAKKYNIKWASPARDDINEIIEYITLTNEIYTVKVLDKIEENVEKLKTLPTLYRIVPELEKYGYLIYREIIVDYWRVIYKIENNLVYIMLVIDGRRNLEDILLKTILLREKEI
ncbi:MAG: type II toxin-antitoxin system RelE/ParE family toxin [Treponema sp.]|nr:type II toxin-antitoxin system RelE/ParE family toxin [Treponema sp.]